MRWLAVHLPKLPLEVYTRAAADPVPLAVLQDRQGHRVLLCNAAAAAQGVRPGLLAGAVRALAVELRLLPRNLDGERAALEQVAVWCGQFTSLVSLVPPQGLVLEVGRSLRLFRGAAGLLERVVAGMGDLGYQANLCLAPTPGGAQLLAIHGGGPLIADQVALRTALSKLPLAALEFEEPLLQALGAMGLRSCGELLRLPRTGLAERLGIAWLRRLERILGEAPDPRTPYEPPPQFFRRLELPAAVETAEALLFAGRRMLLELSGFLRARGRGVQQLNWRLHHPQHKVSRFTLGLAQPQRDPERLLEVLRERLNRLELPAPVQEIALAAQDLQPLSFKPGELFPARGHWQGEVGAGLLDRLSARLGGAALQGLVLIADHRPERAWAYCPPGGKGTGTGTGTGTGREDRPLWLLPQPVALELRDGWPYRNGRLDLGTERERIEAGWWDGQEVARDYFIATTPQGERLWIYRELTGGNGWFLHGLFG